MIRRKDFGGGFGEEDEPALEVVGVERELKVSHHRVAFVAAGGEQDGGPEVFEGGQMVGPVTDDGVKMGPMSGSRRTLA